MAFFTIKDYGSLVEHSEEAMKTAKIVSGLHPILKSSVETEIRFRAFPPRRTHDLGAHERVKKFMARKVDPAVAFTQEKSTVHLYSSGAENLRRIVNDDTREDHFERKTQDFPPLMNEAFALKTVVSREDVMVPGFKPPYGAKVFSIRKRDRTRIQYEGMFIDLTIVTESSPSGGGGGKWKRVDVSTCEDDDHRGVQTQYEIEIEIPNLSTYGYDVFHRHIRTMFRVIRGTEVPYTTAMYSLMAEFYNGTLSQSPSFNKFGDFDSRLQSKARSLKMKDLVYGGIVSKEVNYSATPKADGTRTALMVQDKTGVWLYGGNGQLNWLCASSDRFTDLHGTILDVESIERDNRTADEAKKFQYFLVVFDTLATQSNFTRGKIDIQLKHHSERMMTAEGILYLLGSRIAETHPNLALICTKTFYYSLTVDQFFDSVDQTRKLIETHVLPYKTDGIVFTPSNLKPIPQPFVSKLPPSKRILQDYPDIVKFKPIELLTIDFAVNVRERELYSTSSFGGKLIRFTARGFNSTINVAWAECEEEKIPKNAIVEFNWYDHQFHPLRFRVDKEKPNTLDVARDNFNLIQDPMTYDTIAGVDNKLFIQSHRKIKEMLFNTAAMSRTRLIGAKKKEYTLLDLGSGKGGDIHRWAKSGFTHVIAVEPSETNIQELKKRIDSLKGEEMAKYPRIDVLQAKAEDTDKIVACATATLSLPEVDVISAMLSASFFWKDDTTLNSVVNTIKKHSHKGTLFLMFSINGQLIEELISPSMREGIVLESPVELGGIRFDFPIGEWEQISGRPIGGAEGMMPHATGRSYTITFKDTRTVRSVEDYQDDAQREYMVYPSMLTEMLKPEFVLKTHEIANKEPLLKGPWRIATSLYSYLIYERIVE